MFGCIMKNLLAAVLMLTATPCLAWSTVDEFEKDFETAKECRPIEGRKVWAGKEAYYIQSWFFRTGDSGLLDEESASAVAIADNDKEALQPFVEACQ